jgi:uncharacterized membrane protein YdfJ with MMPL/SSD domain
MHSRTWLVFDCRFSCHLVFTSARLQFGFALFFGVIVDTFLVRALVVPAVITMLRGGDANSKINWWPMEMPTVVLPDADEEERALRAGHSTPPPR